MRAARKTRISPACSSQSRSGRFGRLHAYFDAGLCLRFAGRRGISIRRCFAIGLHTHQRALDAGDSYVGATVHYVTGELDGGPPILQRLQYNQTTTRNRSRRVLQVEHQIYPTAINWHLSGRLQFEQGRLHLDDKLVAPTGQQWEPS